MIFGERADELMLYLIRFCIKSDPSGAKMKAHLFSALLSAVSSSLHKGGDGRQKFPREKNTVAL